MPFVSADLSGGGGRQERVPIHDVERQRIVRGTPGRLQPGRCGRGAIQFLYASNNRLTDNVTGRRWFWTDTLGTVYAAGTDSFAAETLGNAMPGIGHPLQ